MFSIFDDESLSSSKKIHIGVKDCIFTTKHNDICYYNPHCFMSGVLIIDDIIINFYIITTEKHDNKVNHCIISK